MRFTDLLATAERAPADWTLDVPEDWRQGRAVFGGLQTALCLVAMRDVVDAAVPLRTLQTTFLAPPSTSRVRATARVLRRGKSATHVEARLLDGADGAGSGDEATLAIVIGVFGAARASVVEVTPVMPRVSAATPTPFRFVAGVTPTFTQHFDATWLTGALPFSGSPNTPASVQLGMRGEPESSEALIVALADFIPPLALSMLRTPAPGSSLTWMLELLTDTLTGFPVQGLRVDAELLAGRDGYTSQSCLIWGPSGQAIALSRQAMVVFG
jgi:acyl-coenzyme A thioesterase PaaI-like protein